MSISTPSSPKMNFREADIACSVEQKRRVSAWIKEVIQTSGSKVGEICVVSCSDEYLLGVNVEHLNHDYYTDIITFDYCADGKISGDLLISFDRVRENASDEGVSFQNELRRVIIHGVLHLLGLGDKSDEEAAIMRAQENKALKLFHVEQ
jgi:probable rRNA maturation factor